MNQKRIGVLQDLYFFFLLKKMTNWIVVTLEIPGWKGYIQQLR